jgi:catechol 2,3-dioxygenase-like lactoylglutathione lyase family enzyme
MGFTLHHTAVAVSDLARALAFYEALGFATVFQGSAQDGSRTITHLRLGEGMIELISYPEGGPRPEPGRQGAPRLGLMHIAFAVDDIDAALAGLQAAGMAAPGVTVSETPFGLRIAFIEDPDGTSIEFVEHADR